MLEMLAHGQQVITLDPTRGEKKQQHHQQANGKGRPAIDGQHRAEVVVHECPRQHANERGCGKMLKPYFGQPGTVTDDIEGNEGRQARDKDNFGEQLIGAAIAEIYMTPLKNRSST
ncbi:MAG: hypothetical protein R8K46_10575 [Mariprofundaceae bacterium]